MNAANFVFPLQLPRRSCIKSYMNTWIFVSVLGSILLLVFVVLPCQAQSQPPTERQVEDEVQQLRNDLNDPNYDYSRIPQQMRQVFQDMRSISNGLDPYQARQYRSEIMQEIRPVIAANRAKIQQAMQMSIVNDLQQPLGSSDVEFAALRPLIFSVVQAERLTQSGVRPGGNSINRRQNQPLTPVQQAETDLQNVLNDPGSTSFAIGSGVSELREAREKARDDLKIAQRDLRTYLTVRQEAVLVSDGVLD
jgi:hypothetical protein